MVLPLKPLIVAKQINLLNGLGRLVYFQLDRLKTPTFCCFPILLLPGASDRIWTLYLNILSQVLYHYHSAAETLLTPTFYLDSFTYMEQE
jgi:hypothetical protein